MTDVDRQVIRQWMSPQQGAIEEKRRAIKFIQDILKSDPTTAGRNPEFKVKGSWATETNVPGVSDIDIEVSYSGPLLLDGEVNYLHVHADDIDYCELEDLAILEDDDYPTPAQWRRDVARALTRSGFEIAPGSMAITVHDAPGFDVSIDVVPSVPLRMYVKANHSPKSLKLSGVGIWNAAKNQFIYNWPERQLTHTETLDTRTQGWYRRIIRALKRLQLHNRQEIERRQSEYGEIRMRDLSRSWKKDAQIYTRLRDASTSLTWDSHDYRLSLQLYPSYMIESLVCNVMMNVFASIKRLEAGGEVDALKITAETIERMLNRWNKGNLVWDPVQADGVTPLVVDGTTMFDASTRWDRDDLERYAWVLKTSLLQLPI